MTHYLVGDTAWPGTITSARRYGKPVVVIDHEDESGDLSRLWRLLLLPDNLVSIDQLQAALREFANPKPPKPQEPTGLGAVVRDAKGKRWVRTDPSHNAWTEWDSPVNRYSWFAVDAVEVLSHGYPVGVPV